MQGDGTFLKFGTGLKLPMLTFLAQGHSICLSASLTETEKLANLGLQPSTRKHAIHEAATSMI